MDQPKPRIGQYRPFRQFLIHLIDGKVVEVPERAEERSTSLLSSCQVHPEAIVQLLFSVCADPSSRQWLEVIAIVLISAQTAPKTVQQAQFPRSASRIHGTWDERKECLSVVAADSWTVRSLRQICCRNHSHPLSFSRRLFLEIRRFLTDAFL